jgi:stearoyl-CoA desaturase (delta-9 desaturase)
MIQQLPWAVLFYAAGGWPWLIWGIPVRIAVSLTGHWLVVHLTHRNGPQGWVVEGESVQGHDLPAAAWLTFGEAWHATHHAWPDSARLGIEPGQADAGWWLLRGLERLGLVWDLKQPGNLEPRAGVRRVATAGAQPEPPPRAPSALRSRACPARWRRSPPGRPGGAGLRPP